MDPQGPKSDRDGLGGPVGASRGQIAYHFLEKYWLYIFYAVDSRDAKGQLISKA